MHYILIWSRSYNIKTPPSSQHHEKKHEKCTNSTIKFYFSAIVRECVCVSYIARVQKINRYVRICSRTSSHHSRRVL